MSRSAQRFLLSFALALASLLGGMGLSPAWAKKVVLEWKAVPGAVQYEIHIQDENGKIRQKLTEETRWKGDLLPGAYSFQIRAIDEAKRYGAWTEPRALALMPDPPNVKAPADGADLAVYSPNVTTVLKWDLLPGIKKYVVEIRKDDRVFSKTRVDGNRLELKKLPEGKYSWRVNPILSVEGRSPATSDSIFGSGRSWEGQSNKEQDFEIKYKKLESPTIEAPAAVEQPPDSKEIKLAWDDVEGADLYEVRLVKAEKRVEPKSNLEGYLTSAKRRVSREPHLLVSVLGEGSYVWGVRALGNLDERKMPQAVGSESLSTFLLDRNAAFRGDLGYIALSSMYAPYYYRIVSPFHGFSGSTSSSSLAARVSAEFWLTAQWALGAAAEAAAFKMNNQDFHRTTFEFNTKYRIRLSANEYGWTFSPKVGAEFRTYNFIYPSSYFGTSIALTDSSVSVLGVAGGIDIRKQFSRHLSLGIKVGYFYPISLLKGAVTGSRIDGTASYRNYSFGIQGLYWFGRAFGVGLGGYFEMRSISFTTEVSATSEQTYMDGSYFFGSLIYRMWK